MSTSSTFIDCFQVKVEATMTDELKCLYNKLGAGMFQIEALSEFDASLEVPDLAPEILEVEFDKCDPCKVVFTVHVEIPVVLLVNPEVDIDPQDDISDTKGLPIEHRISTGGHLNPVDILTFTVYPLAPLTLSQGYDTKCFHFFEALLGLNQLLLKVLIFL